MSSRARHSTAGLYALWLLLLGLVLIAGSACRPAQAAPSPGLRIERVTERYVVFTITPPTVTDGKGAIDGFRTKLRQGTDSTVHAALPATATRDSFAYTPAPFGQTATGEVCAASRRRALLSVYDCEAWSYTEPDSPPPPPNVGVPVVIGSDTFRPGWLNMADGSGLTKCQVLSKYSTELNRVILYPVDSTSAPCMRGTYLFNQMSAGGT